MKHENEFTTFYFENGFETLIPLASFLEDKFKAIEFGVGSNFINVYTERTELMTRIERAIKRWSTVAPHVQLDRKEHGV